MGIGIASGTFGLVLLVVTLYLWFREKSKSPRMITALMLISGLFIGGSFKLLLTKLAAWVQAKAGAVGANVFGVSASAIMVAIGVLICLELRRALFGKAKAKVSGWVPWMALLAPALLLAGGGFLGDLVAGLHSGVTAWMAS